jgi:hypothetical protein
MFTIQYMIYIFNIQSCAMHAQSRMQVYARFSLVPSNLYCYSETTDGRKQSTRKFHSSDYVFSCRCNKETPKTIKPLKEGDNQTDSSITQIMQEEADQVIPLLPTWNNLGANIIRIVN